MGEVNESAFLAVIYPGAEPFLMSFFESLRAQTVSTFDIVLVNDGIADPERYIEGIASDRILTIPGTGSVIENRERMLKAALDRQYKYLFFADCDDMQQPGRVENVLPLLADHSMVVNDLALAKEDGTISTDHFLGHRLGEQAILQASFLFDKNIAGMGNTALRADVIPPGFTFPPDCGVTDWYLFTRVALNTGNFLFTATAETVYRQHHQNFVGLQKEHTHASLLKGLNVKKEHYRSLVTIYPEFQSRYNAIERTIAFVEASSDNADAYVAHIKSLHLKYPFWWEEIQAYPHD